MPVLRFTRFVPGFPLWLLVLWLALCSLQARGAEEFLPPEQAFQVSLEAASSQSGVLVVRIAPGYYVYHESIQLSAEGAQLAPVRLPAGKVKFDENFQKEVETHRTQLRLALELNGVGSGPVRIHTRLQGCADAGLCYPPMTIQTAWVEVAPASRSLADIQGGAPAAAAGGWWAQLQDGSLIDRVLESRNLGVVALAFLMLGVLLSLTPCVLPMVPILSSLIVGADQGGQRWRSGLLALSYVLGMATVYTGLGVAAGYAGEGLGAALQTPWAIGGFSLLLLVFALSMFDVYEMRLPSRFSELLTVQANRLPAGQLMAVWIMGGISALIVSPCVTAPMAGALLFISRTGDVALGGLALFSMAIGMGVPLLLIGVSAGHWLPRTGPWMYAIKRLFGLLLLGVALWTARPIVPMAWWMGLWGLLLLGAAVLMAPWRRHPTHGHRLRTALARSGGVAAAIWGVLLLAGALTGADDPLQPWAQWTKGPRRSGAAPQFQVVRTQQELTAALASVGGRIVMLDVSAEWCVACKEMERFTFQDGEVADRLRHAALLKVDVTSNDAAARDLLKRFKLFGPPATLFLDQAGQELAAARVIGFQPATKFLRSLSAAGL